MEALDLNGFAVVRDLFTSDDIREAEILLDELCVNLQSRPPEGRDHRFYGEMRPVDGLTAQDRADGIDQFEVRYAASFEPRLLETRLFRRCEAYARALCGDVSRSFDHAIIKSARNVTETPWHQDAAFHRFGAARQAARLKRLHFWIPLQDVGPESGCMEFIAGSHRNPLLHHDRFQRSSGTMGYATTLPDDSRRVACPLSVGGLTVHLPGTVHYCGRNASDRPRKAWIIQFARFGEVQLFFKRLAGWVPKAL